MKKLSIIAASAAIAAAAAAPVAAQENTQDPFVSSAGVEIMPLVVIGGVAAIIAIASASGTD
jgi:polyisoprenoid-binding protein YceI